MPWSCPEAKCNRLSSCSWAFPVASPWCVQRMRLLRRVLRASGEGRLGQRWPHCAGLLSSAPSLPRDQCQGSLNPTLPPASGPPAHLPLAASRAGLCRGQVRAPTCQPASAVAQVHGRGRAASWAPEEAGETLAGRGKNKMLGSGQKWLTTLLWQPLHKLFPS